jgi:heme-degrading monooxygenase HmoA
MNPVTIDLQKHPNLQFRIDSFTVPAAVRPEFVAQMRKNLAVISKQPGFLGHVVFEKTGGPTTFDIATIAVWESPEAVAAATGAVRAHYESTGFDMRATLARWGVVASIGDFRAPAELQ